MSKSVVFGAIDNVLATVDFKDAEGSWIAIVDDKIVAEGSNAKEVYDKAASQYPCEDIFIGRFPETRAMLL